MSTPRPESALHPVSSFFPGRSPRWIADTCRAGRLPGAIKVGRTWVIRASDIDALVAGAATGANDVPSEDEIARALRAHGLEVAA